jgi:GT2 family glycosyltransferase
VVIATYRRGPVLVRTVRLLLALDAPPGEILVVDQTPGHDPDTTAQLTAWDQAGVVRWILYSVPSITGALNIGLMAAKGAWVLFLDDDIIPSPGLVAEHAAAAALRPDAWAVAGQVLQPGQSPAGAGAKREAAALRQDLDFEFNSAVAGWVTNAMAGNLCVHRARALALGGFDENFGPPVAFRFETEFAKRMVRHGGKLWFEPKASIEHLRVTSGGTRSQGGHLMSASPVHGVGDYYYALCCGQGWDRVGYMLRRPFREVRTRFHLSHPWWIPVKLLGELRAVALALQLRRKGPRYLDRAPGDGAGS